MKLGFQRLISRVLTLCLVLCLITLGTEACRESNQPTSNITSEPSPKRCERYGDPESQPQGFDLDGDGLCDGVWPDWSEEVTLESGRHRGDVFQLGDQLPALVEEGLLYAQSWPIEVSGVFIPYQMLTRTLDPNEPRVELQQLRSIASRIYGFDTLKRFYDWLGLVPYNEQDLERDSELNSSDMSWMSRPPYHSPRPQNQPPEAPMGASLVETPLGIGLTFTCTACHAGRLLGRTVIGLANKRSRANDFFAVAHQVLPALRIESIRNILDLSEDELALLDRSIEAASSVAFKAPEVLGLDTSVAHVGLSLALRGDDPHASPSLERQDQPAPTPLTELIADSKPLPWWITKYKTRWFADASVVAGNPLIINLLWNEIGRGTDLRLLDAWLESNRRVIDALTAAVFASEAPRWTDFFEPSSIDLAVAQRGQSIFNDRCSSCHGVYEKGWNAPDAATLTSIALLETTRVVYHAQTPTFDVGTDMGRLEGQAALHDQISTLHIYNKYNIKTVRPQGYVPPPLDGIWARYPYLHNNSVPTLCALLSPVSERPVTFRQGPSESTADFDAECVGYPIGEAIPDAWSEIEKSLFDTRKEGLSNRGHDESTWGGILTPDERRALIMFLKTL